MFNFFLRSIVKSTSKSCCKLYNSYTLKLGMTNEEACTRLIEQRFHLSSVFRKHFNPFTRKLLPTKNLFNVIVIVIFMENIIHAKRIGDLDFMNDRRMKKQIRITTEVSDIISNIIKSKTSITNVEELTREKLTSYLGAIAQLNRY